MPLNPPQLHSVALLAVLAMSISPAVALDGCCFSFGFGAMMKPCCLKAHASEASNCPTGGRMGGATGFTTSACPSTASAAAELYDSMPRPDSSFGDGGLAPIPADWPSVRPKIEHLKADVCSEPMCSKNGCPGFGRAFIPVFAFDSNANACIHKVFGGMLPSKNQFVSLEDCQATCMKADSKPTAVEQDASFGDGGGLALIPQDWPSRHFQQLQKDASFGNGGASIPSDHSSLQKKTEDEDAGGQIPVQNDWQDIAMGPAQRVYEKNAKGVMPEEGEGEKTNTPVAAQAGCCFSLGYGAFSKPCCLKVKEVANVALCSELGRRLGGQSSYNLGRCPTDALEADQWTKTKEKMLKNGTLSSLSMQSESGPLSPQTTVMATEHVSPSSSRDMFGVTHDATLLVLGMFFGMLLAVVMMIKFGSRRLGIRTPFLTVGGDGLE